jgi:hypothetical protein
VVNLESIGHISHNLSMHFDEQGSRGVDAITATPTHVPRGFKTPSVQQHPLSIFSVDDGKRARSVEGHKHGVVRSRQSGATSAQARERTEPGRFWRGTSKGIAAAFADILMGHRALLTLGAVPPAVPTARGFLVPSIPDFLTIPSAPGVYSCPL